MIVLFIDKCQSALHTTDYNFTVQTNFVHKIIYHEQFNFKRKRNKQHFSNNYS